MKNICLAGMMLACMATSSLFAQESVVNKNLTLIPLSIEKQAVAPACRIERVNSLLITSWKFLPERA